MNYLAPIFIAQEFYPHLAATRGSFLMFTSSSYTRGRSGYSLYSSAKAGLVNLTQALADEWAGSGVRVNCICPGTVRTPMIADMLAMLEDYLKQNIPLQRVAEPEEIARVALFLASGEASYITGAIIPVDGCWTTM